MESLGPFWSCLYAIPTLTLPTVRPADEDWFGRLVKCWTPTAALLLLTSSAFPVELCFVTLQALNILASPDAGNAGSNHNSLGRGHLSFG